MKTGILLSGGMDSISIAYWKRPAIAYTIDYGQLQAGGEIRAASAVCETLGIRHRILMVDCGILGSGEMAGRKPSDLAPVPEWWPFRNQLLITIAGAAALDDDVRELIFGTVNTDAVHADGRRDFFERINGLMESQEGHIRVCTPAIELSSAELVRKSDVPQSILAWSHSCHSSAFACGTCRGCVKHANTMIELGYGDY